MSNLTAYKDTGEILFDTNLIAYGLVKSGYMTYLQSWSRRELRSNNLDPTQGGNYTPVNVTGDPTFTDALYGFTVNNPISPVVFITGPGCLNGTQLSGSSMTFFYSNATSATRFYCFDLMADIYPGSTFLKTWDTTGRITFNSLQPPMNVIAAVQAPGAGALDRFNHYSTCYAGGYNTRQPELGPANGNRRPRLYSTVDIPLNGGIEYAVYLPWSRTVKINDMFDFNGFSSSTTYSGQEGAYGRAGGISFMFGPSAGTSHGLLFTSGYAPPCSFELLPVDRFPVALAINTASLIFPYN